MDLAFVAAATTGLWLGVTAVAAVLERALAGRRIWSLERWDGQLRLELLASLRFLVLFIAIVWGASALGALRFASEGSVGAGSFAVTWLFTWTFFEVFYYGLHRALHTRPLYRFHEHHHRSRVTTPLTGFSLSTVESLGWILGTVLPPIALSLVAPVHLEGWLFYVACNFYVNVSGHMNAEMMPAVAGTRAASWLTHPLTYHALHHARFRNHYSFASSFMDRLFGTEWDDWQDLHRRVVAGSPLERFSVRGASGIERASDASTALP